MSKYMSFLQRFFPFPPTVHAETAITNAHCLNRLHKKFGKIIIAKDVLEAQDMVLAGKVGLHVCLPWLYVDNIK